MTYELRKGVVAMVVLAVVCLAPPAALAAEDIETVASIRDAIQSAVAPRLAAIKDATVDIAVGAIDSRLRLPSCPSIEITLPATNAALMTARVECNAPSWTLYVPIRLHAWIEAVVARANLTPNTRLAADHLALGRVDMFSGNGGVLTEPSQAEGKILRVGLIAGAPILSPFLDLPIVVHRGQNVLVTLTASTMIIRATAVALEDGRAGENITVENPDSKKKMHATVVEDGSVELNF
jgi:flagella basal body P-ring formation protein FlgA